MNLFNQPRSAATPEQLRQIKRWTAAHLGLAAEVPISISQLQCHEPGCAPVETVIAVMTQPPQSFKIHRAIADIRQADVEQGMRLAADGPPQ